VTPLPSSSQWYFSFEIHFCFNFFISFISNHFYFYIITVMPNTIISVFISFANNHFYPRDVVSAVYATVTWLAGCLSVTRQYCIKTAKPILKLFQPSGSSIILVISDSSIPKSKGNPLVGTLKHRGWENWRFRATFDGNRRLSRKRCETGRWLLWNVNRKSWVPDWMVSSSMTLSDPNPGFKVTVYLQVEYIKNGAFKGSSY